MVMVILENSEAYVGVIQNVDSVVESEETCGVFGPTSFRMG